MKRQEQHIVSIRAAKVIERYNDEKSSIYRSITVAALILQSYLTDFTLDVPDAMLLFACFERM